MIELKEYIANSSIENEYSKTVSLEHRKKFAQFFTPLPIADLMAKWILGNVDLKTVLEPAFGLGIFARTILASDGSLKIRGFEIDKTIFEKAKNHFVGFENVTVLLQDYMYNDWNNKYDGIICNPPYFKFHDYDNKNIIKEIETKLKCKLNGFTNLYTLFLLKSIYQLNANGRCAYIIPSEFLNADYGKLVKSYLLKSNTLRHIVVVNFQENVFDDALTTASIILCANDNATTNVQFSNVQSMQDLGKIEQLITNYPISSDAKQVYNASKLDPAIKWKAYYQKQNGIRFKNLVPFSNYAKVVRGIATGSNDYFTFNQSKLTEFSIKEKYLLPCICRAADVKRDFFTTSDFRELRLNGRNVFLLNANGSKDENVAKYLEKGEQEGIHEKFLTANRTPWYALENRPPSPIWVSVFNRTGLRFVRNEANISNLTSYHCVYPKQTDLFTQIEIDLMFAYLLTDTAKQIFEDNSREYGNGLQKFEPNDLNKGQMLDLGKLSEKTKKQILNLYRAYRLEALENRSGKNLISQIDEILIKNFSETP
ncbi:MAG: SAM-dependent methyltransferase [Saprospiraceae bacterium]|nr:SAM-dependent methyltransferase [Saprospiraceae bacterium]MCF8248369.1 SAM-dependent methyltransferase [Saprospiraceae bacterium]MCF8309897.1 SAM-dependent methyltransferase [Saprospiraceae bacterium]MCF8438772.1 SAM-dependent methyltransferase [Saprospiraceae bacterium]